MRLSLLALVLFLPQETTPEEFLKKVEAKYTTAKSVQWKSAVSLKSGQEEVALTYEIVVKGDQYRFSLTVKQGTDDDETRTELCDGKIVIDAEGTETKAPTGAGKALLERILRLGPFAMLVRMNAHPRNIVFNRTRLALEKSDKVGGRQTQPLASIVKWNDHGAQMIAQTLWFDSETLAFVKSTVSARDSEASETISGFAFDAEIPAAAFAPPKETESIELAPVRTALEYYAAWNGEFPAKLEDLVTRPASAKVWPEGGYLDRVPKVEYAAGKLTGTALAKRREAFPDEKSATSRYRLAQIRVALRAQVLSNGSLPTSLKGLGVPTKDGYGVEFSYDVNDGVARLSSKGRVGQPPTTLTDEMKKKIADLVQVLSSESVVERGHAREALEEFDPVVLPYLKTFIDKEKDPEVKAQLDAIAVRIAFSNVADASAISALVFAKPGPRAAARNERNASASLRTIATAEADFRSNDRENDRAQNFWVGDVHGLFALCPSTNGSVVPDAAATMEANMNKLIEPSLADADAAPVNAPGIVPAAANPVPKAGYLFKVVPYYVSQGKPVAYGTTGGIEKWGKLFNFGKFSYCAFPAEYAVTGRKTFFMDESITIWWKDTGGEPVLVAPENPATEGWAKLD